MRILALDPATKCGFAYGTIDELASGSWLLKEPRDSGGMRLVEFKRNLNKIREFGIGLVVFERPAGFHKGAIIVQSELQAVLKLWCEEVGVPYRAYSSKEIKLYATGKGGATKGDMLNAAIHKFGVDCGEDNDQADALALWHLAYSEYGDGDGIPPTPKVEKPKPAKKRKKKTLLPENSTGEPLMFNPTAKGDSENLAEQ